MLEIHHLPLKVKVALAKTFQSRLKISQAEIAKRVNCTQTEISAALRKNHDEEISAILDVLAKEYIKQNGAKAYDAAIELVTAEVQP